MFHTEIEGIKISAMAAAVSNNWESIPDVMHRLGREDAELAEKFDKTIGVKGRYNAGLYQTTSDFCFAAAKRIIEAKSIDPRGIGILVFITEAPDYLAPSTACLLQNRLGLSQDCIAFDVNLGCSGFTNGVNIVSSLLKASNAGKALLLCGETPAKEPSTKNKTLYSNTANFLFGDAGTATLFEKYNGAERIHMLSKTDGSRYKTIITPYGAWRNPDLPLNAGDANTMDELGVFSFATREVPLLIEEAMKLNGASVDDYDCLALHQANLFIMKRIAKKVGFPYDKLLISIDEFANTISATIPVTLVKRYGDEAGKGLHVMSCGYGVGLAWSTVDFYIRSDDILPLVHTDEFFDDGYKPIEQ